MHRSVQWTSISGLFVGVLLGVTCKATSDARFVETGVGGESAFAASSSTAMAPTPCDTEVSVDDDGDGYSDFDGDCNDCNAAASPGSVEVSGDLSNPAYVPVDEDCDGAVDEPNETCDGDIALYSADAMDAARAVDLCKISSGIGDWGVISTTWVMADGSPSNETPGFHLGHGMLSSFGTHAKPRIGARMLAISSGTARQPTDSGYISPTADGFIKNYTSNPPEGFPKEAAACPGVVTGQPNDVTAIEISVRAPTNANGFSFEFNFYTSEWPNYICTQYNDLFVAVLSPIPVGQTDGQISFDGQGNPISVNNAFLGACACASQPPCYAGGKPFGCPLGDTDLWETGFDGHAATGWLKTQAPIEPGQVFHIRWGVYDSGDGKFDSTTLIDDWQWIAKSGTTITTMPSPEIPK